MSAMSNRNLEAMELEAMEAEPHREDFGIDSGRQPRTKVNGQPYMSHEEREDRAAARADAEFPFARACELGSNAYRVFGRRNDPYTVERRNDRLICNCPAGQHDNPCWHAALVRSLWPVEPVAAHTSTYDLWT